MTHELKNEGGKMPPLNQVQAAALRELCAACDEVQKYRPASDQWVKSRHLSGTREERSAKTLRALVSLGLAEAFKPWGHENGQSQWRWRITPAGRDYLSKAEGRSHD